MTLTLERAKELVSYDPESGLFRYFSGRGHGGSPTKDGYRQIKLDQKKYFAHRLAWFMQTGSWPTNNIDHKNGDRADNRWINLREATVSENAQNLKIRTDGTSNYLGVSRARNGKKWLAQIRIKGACHRLGYFEKEEDAALAYIEAKARLHPFQPVLRELLAPPSTEGGEDC